MRIYRARVRAIAGNSSRCSPSSCTIDYGLEIYIYIYIYIYLDTSIDQPTLECIIK